MPREYWHFCRCWAHTDPQRQERGRFLPEVSLRVLGVWGIVLFQERPLMIGPHSFRPLTPGWRNDSSSRALT